MKDFEAFDHGTGTIAISHKGIQLMRPTQIHHKADGSLKDQPTFAIVMESPDSNPVIGEISLEMLNDGLKDIGYQMIKI